MGEPIRVGLASMWARRAFQRGLRNDGAPVVCALLDTPDSRAMGLLPIVISLGTELRATGLAGGAKAMTPWELDTLLANGHACKIEAPVPTGAVGPLCAAWLGSEFVRKCEDADAPDLPFDRRSMTRVPRVGWFTIGTPADVFAALDGWYREAFVFAIERRSREIAELLSWVDPNRDETRTALYLSGNESQRERELAWWARLERDAGRDVPDKEALLGRVDASCARVFLDWHPPSLVPALPSPWAHVAIAARCAERLAPPIDPFPDDPGRSAVAQAIRVAREAAIRGRPASHHEVEDIRRSLSDQVHRPWQDAHISDHVHPHALHAVESALFGAERAPEDTHLDQAMLSMQHGIAEIVYPDITWLPLPALWSHFGARADRAIHDDAYWLLRWSTDRGVTERFFERELWPEGPPLAWSDHVEQFRDRLFTSARSDTFER